MGDIFEEVERKLAEPVRPHVGVIVYDGDGISHLERRIADLKAMLDTAPCSKLAPIVEAISRLELDLAYAIQCRDNPIVYATGVSESELWLIRDSLAEEGAEPVNSRNRDHRTPEAKKWDEDFLPPQTCGSIDDVQNALELLRDANSQLRHVAHRRKDQEALADRFREVIQLMVEAQQKDGGNPDDYFSPAEMSDEELIFQATLRLPEYMATDVARLRAGDEYGKTADTCDIRFGTGETPALDITWFPETELSVPLIGYPADGGLKDQVRPFEDTLSVGEVFQNEIERRRWRQFSVSRELDGLKAQQQDPAHDQAPFKDEA